MSLMRGLEEEVMILDVIPRTMADFAQPRKVNARFFRAGVSHIICQRVKGEGRFWGRPFREGRVIDTI